MKTASRLTGVCLAAAATIAAMACSEDAGPEARASMTATLMDSDPGAVAVAGRGAAPQAIAELTGTMSGTAQVFAYSDAGGWSQLGAPQEVSVALQAGNEATVSSAASVPAGTYTRVRLVLSGFQARLQIGSLIDGSALLSAVTVGMGGADNQVEIEAQIPALTLEADANGTVTFDLHSAAWVTPEATQTETAEDAEIQSATTAIAQKTS